MAVENQKRLGKVLALAILVIASLFYATYRSISATHHGPQALSEATFNRCCPIGRIFSLREQGCVPGGLSDSNTNITLPFASVYFNSTYEYMYYEDDDSVEYIDDNQHIESVPNATFHPDDRFPDCDPETETLTVKRVSNNDVFHAEFIIDDENITQNSIRHQLIDLDSYDAHNEYCVSPYDSGTVAVFCETKLSVVCHQRPCVSFCCQRDNVFSFNTEQCESFIHGEQDTQLESLNLGPDVAPQSVKYFFESKPKCATQNPLTGHDAFSMRADGVVLVGDEAYNHTEACFTQIEEWDNNASKFVYKLQVWTCASDK